MQSTGQTSTHELSLVPMQGSAITYAIWPDAAPWGIGERGLRFYSHPGGDHLANARRARPQAGGEDGDRPVARSPGPVPDRALPGSDRRAQSEVRPGDLGLLGVRPGG